MVGAVLGERTGQFSRISPRSSLRMEAMKIDLLKLGRIPGRRHMRFVDVFAGCTGYGENSDKKITDR